jgi:hypothetical protein
VGRILFSGAFDAGFDFWMFADGVKIKINVKGVGQECPAHTSDFNPGEPANH